MNNQSENWLMKVEPLLTIDMPHQLKPKQIKQINDVVSTISEYEKTLKSLRKVSLLLYDAFLNGGQDPNSELCEVWTTIRDLRAAIEPCAEDGSFMPGTGLVGNWNADKQCYDQYK